MASRIRRRRSGFTLAELVVASVSLGVIATVTLTVTLTMYRSFSVLMARAVVTDTLRGAMEQIGRDVQGARATATPCGGYKTTAPATALLILDYPGITFTGASGPPTTGDHVIYRCRTGGTCNTATPGTYDVLERLVVRSTTPTAGDCTTILTPMSGTNAQTIALQVESVQFTTALKTVTAALRVQRQERGFTASTAITDLFRFRGK